jgi:hypothetical protein
MLARSVAARGKATGPVSEGGGTLTAPSQSRSRRRSSSRLMLQISSKISRVR